MKVSEQWLREWVNPSIASEALVEQLTMAGLEVDAVERAAPEFSGVVVGYVDSVAKHPNAEKLTLCKVSIGNDVELLDIVCGASNVRQGLKVAVATVGAVLPTGLKIKKAKLRGEVSLGMLCSEVELGLAEISDGIMELPAESPIGISIREFLNLDDSLIEIDFTPNRGDCLSIRGVAREVAALNNLSLKTPEVDSVPIDLTCQPAVEVNAPEYCPHYLCRKVDNINNQAEVPLWLKEKLRRSNLRSRSLIVDITNYVMMELGQPMHAFDADKIEGDIVVRLANEGEQLILLDGQEVKLRNDTLVIADQTKALAIAGVMGGLDSSVTEQTTNIIFESAHFSPQKLAGIARSYGLTTDSSYRFERGVAPELQSMAMERATELLLRFAGGQASDIVTYCDQKALAVARTIELSSSNVNRLLGTQLSTAEVQAYLERLGMNVELCPQADKLLVIVPAFRFDITIEADLIEEVARIYGYNELPSASICADFQAYKDSESELGIESVRQNLVYLGYNESINYSFICPDKQALVYQPKEPIDLLNPLSKELSQMRHGLWVGLLNALSFNLSRQVPNQKLFEIGLCFEKQQGKLIQTQKVAAVIAGAEGEYDWAKLKHRYDFYDLKGDLELLFGEMSSELRFDKCHHKALHPGKSAAIYKQDRLIGYIGELHPSVVKALALTQSPIVFEVEVEALIARKLTRYRPLSKFPSISRDLSFVVDEDLAFYQISQAITEVKHEVPLQSLMLFDVYQGENIEKGKKSLAIGLTLQHPERTLVDSEVNDYMSAILLKLEEKFDITLRE